MMVWGTASFENVHNNIPLSTKLYSIAIAFRE